MVHWGLDVNIVHPVPTFIHVPAHIGAALGLSCLWFICARAHSDGGRANQLGRGARRQDRRRVRARLFNEAWSQARAVDWLLMALQFGATVYVQSSA